MTKEISAEEKAAAEKLGHDQDALAAVLSDLKSFSEKLPESFKELADQVEAVKSDLNANKEISGEAKAKIDELEAKASEQSVEAKAAAGRIDELAKKLDRPAFGTKEADHLEAKSLMDWAERAHNAKNESLEVPFDSKSVDLDQIKLAKSGMNKLLRAKSAADRGSIMTADEYKSLNSFAFEGNSFIMQPELANEIINCEDDKQDISSFFSQVDIAKRSIKYPVNNKLDFRAAWECEGECWANNPKTDMSDGWGSLEFKPEKLRYAICADSDFLDDAELDMVAWLRGLVGTAFSETECDAWISGDGNGKPTGILHPSAGIPIVDVQSAANGGAPAGGLTWQDLVMLAYQIKNPAQTGGAYFMNQNTLAKVMTMSIANGAPLFVGRPSERFPLSINGFPIVVIDAMPDIAPGATPVAFGNWKDVYRIVRRKALSFQRDDYSGGFCPIFKFESRATGGVICPNKARLLRIGEMGEEK